MRFLFMFLLTALTIGANAQVRVGQVAPEIALPNVNDSIISLSSFKNKVVLIDFWASWCGKCRMANPTVVRLYQKYREQGFEVFSVSIDRTKSNWLNAILQDRITYTQVNDNNGWDAKAAVLYGVDAVPTTFLLDKTGVVVAIDLNGARLDNKVRQLLK